MNESVAYGVALLSVAVAVLAAWRTWRQLPFDNLLFYAMALLELVLVVLLVGGIVALTRTERDVDGGLFVSYLVTLVVIVPAAVLWGIAEKSRWGTGVVVVALLTVAVLCFRLLEIWRGTLV